MFTCAMNNGQFGSGLLPQLIWSGVPAGTMSFAITFIDTTLGENSAMGQHWAIRNIPATVSMIPQGTKTLTGDLSMARQNGNYLSPCAQSLMNNMDDNYEFTIYALPTATLNISGTSVANALDGAAGGLATGNGEAARTRRSQRHVVSERAGLRRSSARGGRRFVARRRGAFGRRGQRDAEAGAAALLGGQRDVAAVGARIPRAIVNPRPTSAPLAVGTVVPW